MGMPSPVALLAPSKPAFREFDVTANAGALPPESVEELLCSVGAELPVKMTTAPLAWEAKVLCLTTAAELSP